METKILTAEEANELTLKREPEVTKERNEQLKKGEQAYFDMRMASIFRDATAGKREQILQTADLIFSRNNFERLIKLGYRFYDDAVLVDKYEYIHINKPPVIRMCW